MFESAGDPAEHEAIADAYMQMYQAHQNEVPSESTRMAYKERMVAAYPFHSTLIDALSPDRSGQALRYTNKPMVTSPNAVIEGLKEACEEKRIGIGGGVNLNALQRKWCGAVVPLDANEEGVWIIPPFEPHPPAPSPLTERGPEGEVVIGGGGGTSPQPMPPAIQPLPPTPPVEQTDTVQRVTIRGAVSLEKWNGFKKVFQSEDAIQNIRNFYNWFVHGSNHIWIAPAISHKGDGEKKVETNTVIRAYLGNAMI